MRKLSRRYGCRKCGADAALVNDYPGMLCAPHYAEYEAQEEARRAAVHAETVAVLARIAADPEDQKIPRIATVLAPASWSTR